MGTDNTAMDKTRTDNTDNTEGSLDRNATLLARVIRVVRGGSVSAVCACRSQSRRAVPWLVEQDAPRGGFGEE